MRTLRTSIVCGALATSIAGFLFTLGAFDRLDSLFGTASAAPSILLQWAGAAILGFGLAWTTVDINQRSLRAVVVASGLMETAGLAWILHLFGINWSPFTMLTAGLLASVFGVIYGQTAAGCRKRQVEALFGGRISAGTLRKVVDSDEPLNLSGERIEASVVVCEIFNSQLLSEALQPKDYVALTNEFLRTGAEALMEGGGMMDDCDGQRLRGLFGAMLPDPDHAAQACEAAYAMGRRLERFCRQCIERWNVAPDYRIGVNSGEMIAAAYGSELKAHFSVAGEALEFCRRLCLANIFYGSRMLLGPKAFQLASGAVEVRPLELIRPRGQQAPEEIYELLAPKNTLTPQECERRDLFWKGVILFRERCWDEAAAHFEAALHDSNCEDATVRFYLDRVANARVGAQALDWDSARL